MYCEYTKTLHKREREREREKERHTERDRQREMYYNKPTTFFNFALDRHNFVFMFDSF